MVYTPNATYLARQRALFREKAEQVVPEQSQPLPKERVQQTLRALGMTRWGMLWPEARVLHRLLHGDEHLEAVVYGHCSEGTALLAATDRRVIFLDKSPLFIKSDELTYDVVTGIHYGQSGFFATITLHTRIRNYKLRTMNPRCANHFRELIEARCLELSYLRNTYGEYNS